LKRDDSVTFERVSKLLVRFLEQKKNGKVNVSNLNFYKTNFLLYKLNGLATQLSN